MLYWFMLKDVYCTFLLESYWEVLYKAPSSKKSGFVLGERKRNKKASVYIYILKRNAMAVEIWLSLSAPVSSPWTRTWQWRDSTEKATQKKKKKKVYCEPAAEHILSHSRLKRVDVEGDGFLPLWLRRWRPAEQVSKGPCSFALFTLKDNFLLFTAWWHSNVCIFKGPVLFYSYICWIRATILCLTTLVLWPTRHHLRKCMQTKKNKKKTCSVGPFWHHRGPGANACPMFATAGPFFLCVFVPALRTPWPLLCVCPLEGATVLTRGWTVWKDAEKKVFFFFLWNYRQRLLLKAPSFKSKS